MVNVVGIRLKNAGKLYFFDPGEIWPTPGDYVLVESTRGMELGVVVTSVQQCDEAQLTAPLKPILRIAAHEDLERLEQNRQAEQDAYGICQHKIEEHGLEMKLVGAEYTFDRSKILFYFTANGRVDFRSLVKDLASVFHTRIELRQIGVRDEAKMIGGLGPCGRTICCGTCLGDFQPVSIKMAKEQNLSLNPTKISGICGRLMCCLKYEQDTYEFTRKRMPRIGKEIRTPDGVGIVADLNIIQESVRVRIAKGDSFENKDYPLEELIPLNPKLEAASEAVRLECEAAPAADKTTERAAADEHSAVEDYAEPQADSEQAQEASEPDEAVEKPAEVPSPAAPPPIPAPAAPQKPRASAWKDALEQAMKAAAKNNGQQA